MPLTLGIMFVSNGEVLDMVSEWEKEELGRLTNQKLQSYSAMKAEREQDAGMQPGKMTLQNLQTMKSVQKQQETGKAKAVILMERLKLALSASFGGLFAPSSQRLKEDKCKVYGHNFPMGTQWTGEFPRCLDCKSLIKDPNQLRGSVSLEERNKFKSPY